MKADVHNLANYRAIRRFLPARGPADPAPVAQLGSFAVSADRLSGLRYLLAVPVPFFRAADGAIWLDPLWLRDLEAHLDYIDALAVLAPCERYLGQPELVKIPPLLAQDLEFVGLPSATSFPKALALLPKTLAVAARAVRRCDIVHSGIAGWPLPPGFVVNPLAAVMRKPLIIVIESAFWRVSDPSSAGTKARVRAKLTEAFARWSIKAARLAIFTHRSYRDSLKGRSEARLHVAPATWISETDILSDTDAAAMWAVAPKRPRFLLAARLVPEKGIPLALRALATLEARGIAIQMDIVGSGPLRDECAKLAATFKHVHVDFPDPRPYGAPFFSLLRGYQAVVVPTISDEQPRVIFDAFSQAIPVIAADTVGNREIVSDGETGWLFPKGDAAALADCLESCLDDSLALKPMGFAALAQARFFTHRTMHLERAKVIADLFGRDGSR